LAVASYERRAKRVSIIPVAALLVVGDIQLPDIGMRAEAVGFGLNERRRQPFHSRSKIYTVERLSLSEQTLGGIGRSHDI